MTIDWWTVGLQAVNVLILVWLLGRFFWRPVADVIAKRQDAARQMLDDAQSRRREAEAALAEITRTRAGLAQERDALLGAAQAEADRQRAARLHDAQVQAQEFAVAARAALAEEEAAAVQAWSDRASRLAVDMALRLAQRLGGAAVRAAFLDWLLGEIRALPEAVRRSAGQAGTADVVSGTGLDPAEQERYRALIHEAFGTPMQLTFKVDAALIVGLELHGPHLTVTNSWRADLNRMFADISHGHRP